MEVQSRRCLGLVQEGHTHAPQRQGQCQVAEEAHHLSHQNALAEQIQMTVQLPVSQVGATGIKDTSRWRGDWYQQD